MYDVINGHVAPAQHAAVPEMIGPLLYCDDV